MKVHFDVLGWLHVFAGVFGILTGLALLVLASGTAAALADATGASSGSAVVTLFLVCGSAIAAGGALFVLVGRGVVFRRGSSRHVVLALAVANLAIVPFGTALGVYTFWVMLNDDARREFGRPLRVPST